MASNTLDPRDTYGVNPLAPDAPPRPTPRATQANPDNAAHQPVADDGDTVSYDGESGQLFRLGLKVGILTLCTMGMYRFWGKTQIRRYLWSRLSLFGDRFEYTGVGKELFLGFLIALAILIPLAAVNYTSSVLLVGASPLVQGSFTACQYAVYLFLFSYATYRARRYRLSRTVLRGIRFWQTGSNVGYALRWMGYSLLTILTLGIARPVGDAALYRYMMRNTWFGSRAFEADGRAGKMMGRWLLCLLLMPVTFGLSLLWYAAFKLRYLVGQTRYQGLALSMPVTFGNLFRLYAPYILVLSLLGALFYSVLFSFVDPGVFQGMSPADLQRWMNENLGPIYLVSLVAVFFLFGLVVPVLQLVLLTHRMLRLVTERLELDGDVDLNIVMQNAAQRPKTGEGLADALDVGGGLEVGI